MSAMLLDGKAIAAAMRTEIREEADTLKNRFGRAPGLAVVQVGEDPASSIYVRNKRKACQEAGIESFSHDLPESTSEADLLELIGELNRDSRVDGILCQLPLPAGIDADRVICAIDPDKDVDGFHPMNVGRLSQGAETFVSCTPAGVMEILKRYDIPISGRECVVVGRSNIVGKPMAQLLLAKHGTVTICHSRTRDLPEVCRRADILVAAVGRPEMVLGSWVKPGAVVVDVGINRLPDGRVVGDVEAASVREVASALTPVPGGVGPMTIACLLNNTLISFRRRHGIR